MARKLTIRRGTTANRLAITPSVGEPVWDKTQKRLYVGDGVTAGGVPVAPGRFYVALPWHGDAVDETVFGYFYAEFATLVHGMLLSAQDGPAGADLTVDIVNGAGVEQTKIATLAANEATQRTIFGAPLSLAAGDVIRVKFKTIGTAFPGQNITAQLICS